MRQPKVKGAGPGGGATVDVAFNNNRSIVAIDDVDMRCRPESPRGSRHATDCMPGGPRRSSAGAAGQRSHPSTGDLPRRNPASGPHEKEMIQGFRRVHFGVALLGGSHPCTEHG